MRSGCVFLLTLAILGLQCSESRVQPKKSILVGGIPVEVEISDTPEKRTRGLMFRRELDWMEGMLFVFDAEDTLSFWMRDTSIPLSIAFINEQGVIIDIQDMKPFEQSPHKSRGVALYALEMNIGWFELNRVAVGDKVFIELR